MFDVLGIFRGVPFIGGFLTLGDSYTTNVVRATRILGEWGDAMVDTDPFLLFRHFIGGGVPFFSFPVPSIFRLNTYDPNAPKAEETSGGGNSTPASSGGVTAAHGGDVGEEVPESDEAAEDPTKAKTPKKAAKADEDDKKAASANKKAQAIIHKARADAAHKIIDLKGKSTLPRPKALTTGKVYEVGSDKIWVTDGINPDGISAFKLPVDGSGTIIINPPSYIPKPYGVYISSENKIYLK